MRVRKLLVAVLVSAGALALVEVGCGTNQRGPIPLPGVDGGTLGGPPPSDGGLVPNDGGFQDAPTTVKLDSGAPPGDGGGF